eukprot:CAMPEP_0182934168 /NCGR_PEP_ID=MMETSP0105_2-20130417/35583_1 /TAXON_ID=81532 ORGANISM="Acanthoeca-like sp., Strain 10tr" /NCGR_SAMPLE_ID=MMETSP0105_2 /ASSEMBLY_ACC=CAM_ASM_000205 /LENGTH=104 /DNA_ID=CAMNT_0025072985 /DNA_START=88 /DNA_END=402 /DNA_ORIENTATION=-
MAARPLLCLRVERFARNSQFVDRANSITQGISLEREQHARRIGVDLEFDVRQVYPNHVLRARLVVGPCDLQKSPRVGLVFKDLDKEGSFSVRIAELHIIHPDAK